MPLGYVAGERDQKFLELGRRLVDSVPGAKMNVLPGGHGLVLENPSGVAAVLEGLDAQAGS